MIRKTLTVFALTGALIGAAASSAAAGVKWQGPTPDGVKFIAPSGNTWT